MSITFACSACGGEFPARELNHDEHGLRCQSCRVNGRTSEDG